MAPSGAENTNTEHNNTTTKPADTLNKRDCSTSALKPAANTPSCNLGPDPPDGNDPR
ncbi:hypothetical protein ABIB14_003114 [Arthrobacter sp. UYEF3]